jgi:hypothetical protein
MFRNYPEPNKNKVINNNSLFAKAAPIPALAPVTSATRPLHLSIFNLKARRLFHAPGTVNAQMRCTTWLTQRASLG